MKLFYIQNTTDEFRSAVSGYFSTFENAQEALKDCCDWYCKDGTGRIYQIDMDVLNAEPILVCRDGSLITPSNELSEAMKKVFSEMSGSDIIKWCGGARSCDFRYHYIEENPSPSPAISELSKYKYDEAFPLCFYNTKKEYEEKIPSIDNVISQATAISEQSKFQDGYVLGLAESEFEMG